MLALIPLLPARRAAPFILTDESAAYRLMATQAVKAKEKKIYSIPVICCVEGCARGEVDLYLGEDHEDLIFRIGAYRVTRDGRVWVNSDPTLLDDEWVVVK